MTINNQSVEKGGTSTITYESTPHSEVKVDALLRNAAGYELQSVWGDVPVNVISRRVIAELELFFAGKELVSWSAGARRGRRRARQWPSSRPSSPTCRASTRPPSSR